jgi:glycogen debranching enzyme
MSDVARLEELVPPLRWDAKSAAPESLLDHEWLATNGLGGYASGTISGAATRRYHGLLVAALPAPLGRWMMLNHLSELIRLPDGTTLQFGGEERAGRPLELYGAEHLAEFRLEAGLPVWRYDLPGFAFEKRVYLAHGQNTSYVSYRLVQGDGTVRLKLRPSLHFRQHDAPVSERLPQPYRLTAVGDRYELSPPDPQAPVLRMQLWGERGAFTIDGKRLPDILYRVEESRGYDSRGDLWSPGYFRVDLAPSHDAALVASTEPWEVIAALRPEEALAAEYERRRRLILSACAAVDGKVPEHGPDPVTLSPCHPVTLSGLGSELIMAADQFLIRPAGRVEDAARARAAGDEVRTVIAGYHWFTDWGRDTMISLDGLTLCTGRYAEAGYILRTFGHYVRDGLIPNMFPEGQKEGPYHTADATLWYFQATARYLAATGDRETLRLLLPRFRDIVAHHLKGTRFGIGVDPADGLLRQGAEGYQLTWMDAKVGDWVVTPRRGKAVEINALWYNALRLLEGWLREEGGRLGAPEGTSHALTADEVAGHAERARASFNRRFWSEKGGYLYDVVDAEGGGDDPSCRPNQVFAVSLTHPVLERARWRPVLDVVQERLLTPVGLRSLAPGSPDYRPKYYGDLRSRDAAYHQGTVWAWLIGPFIDAWVKVHDGDRAGARRFLGGFEDHLHQACLGSISEIFDAEEPFTARGCIAQAWSVAEVLRSWVKTAP